MCIVLVLETVTVVGKGTLCLFGHLVNRTAVG